MSDTNEGAVSVVGTPVYLTPDMIRQIDEQAKREGLLRGRSAIIRKSVARYLASVAEQDREGVAA